MGERNNTRITESSLLQKPCGLEGKEFTYDAFSDSQVLHFKKKGHLPAMGWNSWNAFGSGNTEDLTREIADRITELGLDRLGYSFVVLDDGCYLPERVGGRLANEKIKFPSGFRALADYIHSKGLKFGMYNDIGTNLCAGAEVGTCGHEFEDAQSYTDWGVDFLKVDNCYYLWDNATFSDAANVRFVFAPAIRKVRINGQGLNLELDAVKDGFLIGNGAKKDSENGVTFIGTFDGTGPLCSPIGDMSSELGFYIEVGTAGEYTITVNCMADRIEGIGGWLQIATEHVTEEAISGSSDSEVKNVRIGSHCGSGLFYDDFVFDDDESHERLWTDSKAIQIRLEAGRNLIRLMNHRRQENTLNSYARLLEGLNKANPEHDIIYSMCEWGKTQPHNWAYKVGDSWRILNDITFSVGRDGDPGRANWKDDYTPSITSQYNKAVIMDEFAGLDRGWNDPDMMVIGMNGLTEAMNRTHMTMWCMMNSPLMLGLDLRRITKGDFLYNVIANENLIAFNQDTLGIQAKRIYCRMADGTVVESPDTAYVRDINRVDVLAKPLSDNSVALSFINVGEQAVTESVSIDIKTICDCIGKKMPAGAVSLFSGAKSFRVKDLWSGEISTNTDGVFTVNGIEACGNVTFRIDAD